VETSDQCREVYAYFGLAMYRAQCVEQSVIQLLVFFDFFHKHSETYESVEQWEKDFDEYDRALSRKTMGRLIRKLKELKNIDNELEASLSLTLQKRNWLAHTYFFDRASDFISENGRTKMLEELQATIDIFNKVEDTLAPITKELCDKYGLTETVLDKIQQQMYEDANGDL